MELDLLKIKFNFIKFYFNINKKVKIRVYCLDYINFQNFKFKSLY